ncbi:hypothetical protein D6D08_03933 [Aureobasidium pullulans]|nr:hypothetical protein D6D08_03933 [Aureobasidium pullulans]
MDFFHFEGDSSQNNGLSLAYTTYDLSAISPTAPEPGTILGDLDMPPQMHIHPGNMWTGPPQPAVNGSLEKLLHNYPAPMDQYGQVAPADDTDMHGMTKPFSKRADSGASGFEVDAPFSIAPQSSLSSKRPSVRSSQKSRKDSRVSEDGVTGDKKDKYREKNRVAAAKCRAKKNEHTNHLEDTCRTQSVMNIALKQTEKSLRDELSFWRTQALQHTFCGCHSVQDYNLKKAQSIAFRISHTTTPSPNMVNDRSSSFRHTNLWSSLGSEMASSLISEASSCNSSVFSHVGKSALKTSPITPFSAAPGLKIDRDPLNEVTE